MITANTTTFQFDATTLSADIEVLGGGGGGGSTTGASGAGTCAASAGGGAGGYAKKLIAVNATVRAATKTIVIGAGGASGTDGGVSSYGDTVNSLSCNGGVAGIGGVWTSSTVYRLGGPGGSSSGGGEINVRGNQGGHAQYWGAGYITANASVGYSGAGANSPYGCGGLATGISSTTGAGFATGYVAEGYGAGGAGGIAWNNTASNAVGGAGSPGLVIITEYR
jgi:hypothetical protein